MNGEICFSDVGWTEFTRQIKQVFQTGGLSSQDEDYPVGDRAERQRNLLTAQLAALRKNPNEQRPAPLWNDDLHRYPLPDSGDHTHRLPKRPRPARAPRRGV